MNPSFSKYHNSLFPPHSHGIKGSLSDKLSSSGSSGGGVCGTNTNNDNSIRCPKCREVYSTKEAKQLHTCNSILDQRFLSVEGEQGTVRKGGNAPSPNSDSCSSDSMTSSSGGATRSAGGGREDGIEIKSNKSSSTSPARVPLSCGGSS